MNCGQWPTNLLFLAMMVSPVDWPISIFVAAKIIYWHASHGNGRRISIFCEEQTGQYILWGTDWSVYARGLSCVEHLKASNWLNQPESSAFYWAACWAVNQETDIHVPSKSYHTLMMFYLSFESLSCHTRQSPPLPSLALVGIVLQNQLFVNQKQN